MILMTDDDCTKCVKQKILFTNLYVWHKCVQSTKRYMKVDQNFCTIFTKAYF